MAIVLRTSQGWLIDHRNFVELRIESTTTQTEEYPRETSKQRDEKQEQIFDERIGVHYTVENKLEMYSGGMGIVNRNSDNFAGEERECRLYKLKRDLFNIVSPFRMDTQCKAMVASQTETNDVTKNARTRKVSI